MDHEKFAELQLFNDSQLGVRLYVGTVEGSRPSRMGRRQSVTI
jgi:hypothetical protein